MTTLRLAGRVADDLERIRAHLLEHDAVDIEPRIEEIVQAWQLLLRHPLIGRKTRLGRRELVVGRGERGYVALYAYDPLRDVVTIVGLRAQRELGFDEGG